MSEQIEPVSIFYSYAHKDEPIREQLGKHLSGLEQQGRIVGWHDRCISLGTQWADEISTHLRTARIILLLISPDFINSGYCMGTELKEAMRLHEEGKARVVPILVRSVNYDDLAFSKIQLLPRDAKPVMEVAKRDRVLAQIAKEIRSIVTEFNGSKEQSQAVKKLANGYTEEQLTKDIAVYTTYLTETLRRLKIRGVIPKDRGHKNEDPELNDIFVPLRAIVQSHPDAQQLMLWEFEDKQSAKKQQQYPIVPLLEQYACAVLLGGPGSGKSTVMRHLAWSHAAACRADGDTIGIPLLTGKLIPLRIELRRLSDDRKYRLNYNFLSYTVEMLERNNIKINAHMFEECLKQKRMLLLFDGLDEVATLDERKRLVEEIEHFTLRYPGNHVVVTSRPVGYELASCSRHLFAHATVQSFDDEQINEFLRRWYTYVLQLSPIPYEEQQEIEALTRTLKENTRLHKLAENPLLLTAIAALYRSTRLPDKRVQVYDKCAELLLETWAKLKGTDIRWKEMRMVKEDQYACLAHLGYVLHQRSQQDQEDSKRDKDSAVDVPARFIQKEIEIFLASKRLITEVAEQRLEARRFLDLVRVEAGLIVERGTDENTEPLYGFVHRTFQEYFAAVDVYERYQQEEDPTIISAFLQEHLHNSHWREVILLLLGKLKSKPVTNQLRKILYGEIQTTYSQYAELIEYNLFFVSQCLIEEMSVEMDLADKVISCLGHLVRDAQIDLLRTNALDNLNKIMQTRQYAALSRKELLCILKEDLPVRRDVASILLRNSIDGSEEKFAAMEALQELLQSSYDIAIPAAKALYEASLANSEERQQASQFLLQLIQGSDVSVDQGIQAAEALHEVSSVGTEEREQAVQFLLQLLHRADLSFEQIDLMWLYNFKGEEREQAAEALLELIQRPDLSVGQVIQVIRSLEDNISLNSKLREHVTTILLELMQRSDLSVEQAIQVAEAMPFVSDSSSKLREHVTTILLELMQRSDLPVEQAIQVAEAMQYVSDYEIPIQMLLGLMQRAELSIEQVIQGRRALLGLLLEDENDEEYGEEYDNTLETLQSIGECNTIDAKLRLQAFGSILTVRTSFYEEKVWAAHMLLVLNQKGVVQRYLNEKWNELNHANGTTDMPFIAELAKQDIIPLWIRNSMYQQLHNFLS
jgi:TIR domain/NACHT domain